CQQHSRHGVAADWSGSHTFAQQASSGTPRNSREDSSMARGKSKLTRRDFVRTAAAATAVASTLPRFTWGAAPDKPLKIGLIGCGGRGTGAAHNAMAADPNVKVVALADIAKDRLEACRKDL